MSDWQTPGNPPHNPYGGGYGAYEPGAPRPGVDGVSIAAFVCALTCCAAPVGVGLGIAGIVRTKDGRRGGRWAAITGLVLGSIASVVLIAVLVATVIAATNVVFEEDARVGQCVNTGFLGTETDDLWDADCSEGHDAEIVSVNVADARLESAYDNGTPIAEICGPLKDDAYAGIVEDDRYQLGFATDAYDDEINDGDWLVCYIERSDGEQITGSVLDQDAA